MITSTRAFKRPNSFINPIYNTRLLLRYPNFKYYASQIHNSNNEGPKTINKSYNPNDIETGWIDYWQKNNLNVPKTRKESLQFHTDMKNEEHDFYMLAPPPNVTGVLHLGHAMTASIQDVFARWYRMKGYNVSWVPGTDHAGISTQVIVEKKLAKDKKLTRHQLGREEFIDEVWKWKNSRESLISHQLKRIGSSMNWDKEYFTMDTDHSKTVQDAFITLFNNGIIYRDTRTVNWSCALQSVISDIEVDHIELDTPTFIKVPGSKKPILFGVMYDFVYTVVDKQRKEIGKVTISTTRPETILGDVAVAIHPQDDRYMKYHDQYVLHPVSQEMIPIVTDPVLVDKDFGTGVVKITPSHDLNDYECSKRHGLPLRNVLNNDGTINTDIKNGSQFNGLTRWEAREKIIDYMDKLGMYKGNTRENDVEFFTSVAICSRSGDVIEPLLMPQWYVKMDDLSQQAIRYVRDQEITIIPSRFEAHWFKWLSEIKDWCISRQLWWGHRVPAYKVTFNLPNTAKPQNQVTTAKEIWVAAKSIKEAQEIAIDKLKSYGEYNINNILVEQDEDVLDTWFSSGLLPLTVFNSSGENSHALEKSEKKVLSHLLETGNDILFFWVSRMVMLCSYFSKCPPFKTVLLHPMICDSSGRKMSKSLGNVLDPLSVIEGSSLETLKNELKSGLLSEKELEAGLKNLCYEYPNGIPAYGADALRMTLSQINVDINAVKENYHFINKLWNVYNFVSQHAIKNIDKVTKAIEENYVNMQLSIFDKYILSRLSSVVTSSNKYLEKHRSGIAAERVKSFILRDFCESYIDYIKPVMFGRIESSSQNEITHTLTLLIVFESCLRLLHPFIPFMTEELYKKLAGIPIDLQRVSKDFFEKWDTQQYVDDESSVMTMAYPSSRIYKQFSDQIAESKARLIFDIVRTIRMVRQTHNIPKIKPFDSVAILTSVSDNSKMDAGLCGNEFINMNPSLIAETIDNLGNNIKYFGGCNDIYCRVVDDSKRTLDPETISVSISQNTVIEIYFSNDMGVESKDNIWGDLEKDKIKQNKQNKLLKHREKLEEQLEMLVSKTNNPKYQQFATTKAKEADVLKAGQIRSKIDRLNSQIEKME
ncbi:hypothetical protein BB558_003668 [Smittium angustum]|uniref:valine--tRNA ligase n=1 Tax=Smittium angustum TaxID=133377 RepID=A0A2U1J5F0_SMIAN|nr:hypothetical protein BB558_003668 [Smittium angustum]